MADMSNLKVAFAKAAAEAEGHVCAEFKVGPRGIVACPHGWKFKLGKPVLKAEAAA